MISSDSPLAAASANDFALGYQRAAGAFDELLDAQQSVRPHWLPFLNALNRLGPLELDHRWEEARHLLRENGVTYDVHGDTRGVNRPWPLDPIPLLIQASEATRLESGLIQRARLLEFILADLYGPQHLLRDGLLPPELVYAHPGFLRPCHGMRGAGRRFLHLYAVDLGRVSDGSIRVLGDRTEVPAGLGYALENRIVLSRILTDLFRDCSVQRVALFFRGLRESLRALAPHNHDNPRVVILTGGPSSRTYFEHAYLARYLGYMLVEGADLTVRDNRVFLKLLGGLQPVDVILRRVEDDLCDPLELRADSFYGVPGLLQAIRAGNVAVVNPPGSALLETPALLPFLPDLCRRLLGEDLKLASMQVYWCGQTRACDHVLTNLARLVIKKTFSTHRDSPLIGAQLSAHEREVLAERIRARPFEYVGIEPLVLSTTPVLCGQRFEPRTLVMRSFLSAVEGTFAVMPGGLTRVGPDEPEKLTNSLHSGISSKDTWVLASGPVSTFSLLRGTMQTVELSRGGGDLPSRAADNLFWMGRYAERAEAAARLLRAILVRLTEWSGLNEVPEMPHLLRSLTHQTQALPGFTGTGAEARLVAPEPELRSLLFDRRRVGSLAWTLQTLQQVAGLVRDRISTDMWRILGNLDLDEWAAAGEGRPLAAMVGVLNNTVITLAAFSGLAIESMTRGEGWRFLDMGRKLERATTILGLFFMALRSRTPAEGPLLEALLEILDSTMTYRRRYLNSVDTAPVLDLLLADEANPRSLAYQYAHLADDIDNLPRPHQRAGRTPEQRIILASLTALRLADVTQLVQLDARNERPHFIELLTRLDADLPLLSDAITSAFLSHLQLSRQLATQNPRETP